ncbi:hypothetical protein Dimus_036528 [Dionaea muscipula]
MLFSARGIKPLHKLLVMMENQYGIDDAESYIEIVVKKVVDDIFKGISDKVDMDMVEEVVKKLKNKEVIDKQRTTKSKTYKRRKTTTRLKPTRKSVVVSESMMK